MSTDNPPTREDFEKCLDKILDDAGHSVLKKGPNITVSALTPENIRIFFQITLHKGWPSIVIQAGKLHRIVGGYPGKNNRSPVCCRVMENRMQEGDERLPDSLKNYGPSMQIRYLLKR